MALSIEITQPNGVPTRYHRIVQLSIVPNRGNFLEMASYVDVSGREAERDFQRANTEHEYPLPTFPFVAGYRIELPYDQDMTIEGAYEALKAMDVFKGAKNVPADGSADQPEEG